ncbi:MAG: UDP-N-acetylmuramate dehydrogenase [Actinobacteria bacterium]|nr:UDP-N-acetylmuramate dehydrogenase [Actinomycetota bacterium]
MSAFDIYCELDGALDGSVSCDERMSRHATFHIGGPASLFIECASMADLTLVMSVLEKHSMPWSIIGKGSNLLISDAGCRSAIITLGKEFKKSAFVDTTLVAGAGIALSSIVQEAFKLGYSGFEFAVGIPGTLGGALFMNAGTRTEWVGSVVEAITLYSPEEGLVRRRGEEIPWSYRKSGIMRGEIILEAELSMKPGDIGSIRAKMEASLSRRKKSQPLSFPSAGSVFKNPPDESAGKLIESVGLKGYRCGGAQISEMHANFIVNTGNAKAQDVVDLIVLARNRVKEVYGIELQPEVQFLGF